VVGSGRTAQREKVLGFGAHTFVDLQRDGLEHIGEVDVVFDVIGGEVLDRPAKMVRSSGTLVTIAEPPRVRPDDRQAVFFVVEPDRGQLAALEQRLRDGRLLPTGDAVCPSPKRGLLSIRPVALAATRSSRWPMTNCWR